MQSTGLLQGIAKAVKPGGMFEPKCIPFINSIGNKGVPSIREMLYTPEDILRKYIHFYYGKAKNTRDSKTTTCLKQVVSFLLKLI